jgi:hypothetical protein
VPFSETIRGHRHRSSLSAIRAKESEELGIEINKTINDLSPFLLAAQSRTLQIGQFKKASRADYGFAVRHLL